ncbi:hypothetical protein GCM10008090_18180 [Arenicella chitinivorans]|uniref:Uncharacterized protein n=1 Tax=Arenicella chitinivorans TaxID=1329800 RepID=A0A918RSN0_9GAMM|nr:hypothetical protein [Arenicella chitinivorans]GHA08677.1 hypothetical protein GCM10008090_18180 [Arenicella chitinivorans]
MKKALFSSILILFTYALFEITALVAYKIKFGEYNLHALQLAKQDAIEAKDQSTVFVPEAAVENGVIQTPILHPYVGFSVDGKRIDPNCQSADIMDCATRIRVDTDRSFAKRSDKVAVIGILGGSFADGTARGGSKKYFDHVMQYIPAFKDKEVVVYNMAMGAYKQPQQLMQLSYYLALGAEFDVVINLDGFNELAATYYGWRDSGLHPAFPKSWNHRVSSSISREGMLAYGKKFQLLESRSGLAEFASGFPTRWSPMINFFWRIMDPGYVNRIVAVDAQIDALSRVPEDQRDFAYEALGPDMTLNTPDEMANYAADLWLNSSLAMRDLAEGNGARYYHFLQPNQYIEGAKPLNPEERKIAILDYGGYGNAYKQLFPALLERVTSLKDRGVHFYDLTYMFSDIPDTLYIDNCCHLNPKGYDMVARKLMTTISDDYYALPTLD